ncbi:MAG: hypothetical protein Q8Q24_01165 [bacterium]|nr:hypothetical protein [bacterium]
MLLNERKNIKQLLPRVGEVEVVGGVYTPYLIFGSLIYFLKDVDESMDLANVETNKDRAKLELTFANKRLLETEKLARGGNFIPALRQCESFSAYMDKAVFYTDQAFSKGEDTEELMWLLEESSIDQQKIFEKIIAKMPEAGKVSVAAIRDKVNQETVGLLKKDFHQFAIEEK